MSDASNWGFIVKEYHDENIIVFQSAFVWTKDQAEGLHSMFVALNGDTYNSYTSQEAISDE